MEQTSKFDLERLSNLTEGERFTSESGKWSVHHYGESGGIVLLSEEINTKFGAAAFEFRNTKDVIKYFKGEKVQITPINVMV